MGIVGSYIKGCQGFAFILTFWNRLLIFLNLLFIYFVVMHGDGVLDEETLDDLTF